MNSKKNHQINLVNKVLYNFMKLIILKKHNKNVYEIGNQAKIVIRFYYLLFFLFDYHIIK